MNRLMHIRGRPIGEGHPPFVIAEMSANHNGRLERALAILEAAKTAGADAVKLQTYRAEHIAARGSGPGFVVEDGPWGGQLLYDLYKANETPWDWHEPLFARARELGVALFSAPFDLEAVEFLETFDVPAFKIASFEIIDHALVQAAAATGKPVILSTGMASLEEIAAAVDAARAAGCRDLALLHCVSGYPTPAEQANLRHIRDLADRFDIVPGLSDHTLGTAVSVAAVALGASIIEKHVTLRRADGGADSTFSLEPEELRRLCDDCAVAWSALGEAHYDVQPAERAHLAYRRSLYVVRAMRAGETFTRDNVRSLRPALGAPPSELYSFLGRSAAVDIQPHTPLTPDLVAN